MMKKAMGMMLLAVVAGLYAGDEVNFNKNFATDENGKIVQWKFNENQEFIPLGKVEAIQGKEGNNGIRITSTGKNVHYYCNTMFPVESGDSLKFTAKVSGSGQLALGGYFYGEKRVFAFGTYPFFSITQEEQPIEKTLVIEQQAGRPAVVSGLIALVASAGSDIRISDLNVEVIRKKK